MKNWQRLRKERRDITDHLIHWTKDFGTLLEILDCGYLTPTFAPVYSVYAKEKRDTIRGSIPAVCFTEQPLDCFYRACKLGIARYRPYGIVVHKYALYAYGGRPVIYGDNSTLEELPDNRKYLWVGYDPIPNQEGYPLDFTHEREWRCTVNSNPQFGYTNMPNEGVPILLPWDAHHDSDSYRFRIIVNEREEKNYIPALVQSKPTRSKILREYFSKLPEASVVSIEEVGDFIHKLQLTSLRFEDIKVPLG